MKLLPKSKPKHYRFTTKLGNVIKLTSLFLVTFTTQASASVSTPTIIFLEKKVPVAKETIKLDLIQKKITGKVTNEKGESLPGVNIIAKGTAISTQTDFDGNFTFEVPDNITVLVVSYIGLQEQEVTIGKTPLTIVLKEVGQQMNEVIVVGYGSQNRRTLSTSV